ncbi:MAG: ATP-binding protein [Bacteroidales bacterium]|nr:ATP-binding protein [Bacteroidales bacterium]MDD3892287.1 ATP-binding protein [Bacteroidales bacterium]
MSKHIANLIRQGEHQKLDFKHSISDSKKIARSLAAFTNTQGGTLLIGVKDNGNVSGVNSDEEYYMLEGAAQMYCKPEVKFEVTRWEINGKVVLEVYVKPDAKHLYKAPDKSGKWKAYFRLDDENMLATPLQVKIWKAIRYRKPVLFSLTHQDNALLDFIRTKQRVTVDECSRAAFMSYRETEKRLINLVVLGVIEFKLTQEGDFFDITP